MKSLSFETPLGIMTAAEQNGFITSLAFGGSGTDKTEALTYTEKWLHEYFKGNILPPPKVNPQGTEYQKRVWAVLLKVPYGKTVTYGGLSEMYRQEYGVKTSPRAIGNALHKNPIPIIIPCHRVIAAGNKIGGYAFGEQMKIQLLTGEKTAISPPTK